MVQKAEKKVIGIIGGSGLYEIEGLEKIRRKKVLTPFGSPSDQFVIGELKGSGLSGVTLVFLPRHGRGHVLSPSEINYRANIFGMKKLGVEYLLSLSAVGSMKEEIPPGDVVIVDQYIDLTKGIRKHTFFEKGGVAHVSFGQPICPELSKAAFRATQKATQRVHPKGTYLCMEGPQFSTRAESDLYRSWGVSVIGMTNMPEAKLAREAQLCYASIAFSTDYDCWRDSEEEVSAGKVLEVIRKNTEVAKNIIKQIPAFIPSQRRCGCGESLKHALVTDKSKLSKRLKKELILLVGECL